MDMSAQSHTLLGRCSLDELLYSPTVLEALESSQATELCH